ncbi:MAG TPA: ion transporter [Planctomycetota bacterium]|nr:ion transporter [Planctomycetota bacterium]
MSVRRRAYEILEKARAGDRQSRTFDIFIMSLIFLNVVALILETVPSLGRPWATFFHGFELLSVLVFTVEYLLRLWSCVTEPRFRRPVWGRLRFAITPLAVIDLLAILPFYLPFLGLDLRFIRSIRLFRIFRVMKLGRYVRSLQLIWRVIREKRAELVMTGAIALLLLVLSSSLMYFIEHDQQPEQFTSIPATMWWAVATLTTVGYGDVYPVTPLGRLLGAITAIIGIGMFALPTAIIGSGFAKALQKPYTPLRTCPHCGKPLDAS